MPKGTNLAMALELRVDNLKSVADEAGDLVRHYVHAGQLVTVSKPAEITTILGTCVAVCLWDPERGVGGLNHYLLPHPVNGAAASSRFGLPAITSLLAEVRRLGAGPRLTAKVFGGMQSTMRSIHDDLGRANADLAFRILQEEGIPVVARDTGGARGRKLIFRVPSGEAWVKYL